MTVTAVEFNALAGATDRLVGGALAARTQAGGSTVREALTRDSNGDSIEQGL